MKVLVILASYNGEKYIKEQIESILSQEGVLVKIIVFDDLSIDKTVALVRSNFIDNRVEIVHNLKQTGSAANNFFGAIKGLSIDYLNRFDYVSFADQDDIWLPQKLFSAIEKLTKDKSSLYLSNLILWEEEKNTKSIINKSYPQKKYDFLFEGGSAGCTYVFTTRFCKDLKEVLHQFDYSNWVFFSHDWFVYFYARINNVKVSIDSNAYILYRIHGQNVHGQLNVFSISALLQRLKLIKQGWYFKSIDGFKQFTSEGSVENKIYKLYTQNYFTRLYVLLRYNFDLMRSFKKFIQFFIISILPIKIEK